MPVAWFVKRGFIASILTFLVRERGDDMLSLLVKILEIILLILQIKNYKKSNRADNTVVIVIIEL